MSKPDNQPTDSVENQAQSESDTTNQASEMPKLYDNTFGGTMSYFLLGGGGILLANLSTKARLKVISIALIAVILFMYFS